MLWAHPDLFSKAACLSSGFAYDPGNIVDSAARSTARLAGTRIYLDCGDRDLDLHFLPDNRKMAGYLNRNASVHSVFKTFPGATHNEQAWSARLWEPLVFLFGTR
jgi:enterochelin esterase-like enzyme